MNWKPNCTSSLLFFQINSVTMIQKDYIMRLAQQVAQILAKLLAKNYEDSLPEIEAVYEKHLPIGRQKLVELPPEELLPFLTARTDIEFPHIEAYAELFYFEGIKLHEASQIQSSNDRLSKAQILFTYLNEAQGVFSFERQEKLQSIASILG